MAKKLTFKEVSKGLGIGAVVLSLGLVAEVIARDYGISDKLSKQSVKYRRVFTTSPFGDLVGDIRYECQNCVYFKNKNACRIVKGQIEADAGCNRWIGIKAEKA